MIDMEKEKEIIKEAQEQWAPIEYFNCGMNEKILVVTNLGDIEHIDEAAIGFVTVDQKTNKISASKVYMEDANGKDRYEKITHYMNAGEIYEMTIRPFLDKR